MSRVHLVAALVLAGACASDDDGPGDTDVDTDTLVVPEGAVDLRENFPDPEWDDAVTLSSKPLVIGPFEEKQFCTYTRWPRETLGIHQLRSLQTKFGHHFILAATTASEREIADGEVVDCTDANSTGMASFRPMIIGGAIDPVTHRTEFSLPDGLATRVTEGQRVVLQSHYVNTSADTIVVQDEIQFEVVPEDEVGTWSAAWVNTRSDLDLPPGESSVSVTCAWEQDYTILFATGHMHEWGKAFSTTFDTAPDGPRVIYDVPAWDPFYRDVPPNVQFPDGSLTVGPGDTFTTRCTWDNDTGANLKFPSEMCAASGMMYPAEAPLVCDPS